MKVRLSLIAFPMELELEFPAIPQVWNNLITTLADSEFSLREAELAKAAASSRAHTLQAEEAPLHRTTFKL